MIGVKTNGEAERGAVSAHLVATAFLLATAVVVCALATALLVRAAADPARTGRFTAFFPVTTPPEARLLAIVAAGGVPVRESWIPGGIELESEEPGIASRLEAEGARLVLPGLPTNLLAAGGCSGGSLADFPDRPALSKLRAGPL
ncbi:MAG: hypothetical protein KatS3mg117_1610 [Geminicoccaceae bacterium]|jgi:hypothetical protein|nr:MAG: hypothetical protein KatS3mg117_1610 [Geminicoccaceae bacterium]